MANFNEKINFGDGMRLIDPDQKYFIYRSDSASGFERDLDNDLYYREGAYRLVIQYKASHCIKRIAGHRFMWECASATSDSVEVKRVDCYHDEDFDDFGAPRFDSIDGAILITEKHVYMYGDTWIEAFELHEKYVVCYALVCGHVASLFRIPAGTFDRFFGLKENFQKEYRKIFGNTNVGDRF